MKNFTIIVYSFQSYYKQAANSDIIYKNIEKHIVELASDSYKGRQPMTETEPLVLDYISFQMKEIGLEGASNGSYSQDVSILAIPSKLSNKMDFETPGRNISFEKRTEYVAFLKKDTPKPKIWQRKNVGTYYLVLEKYIPQTV